MGDSPGDERIAVLYSGRVQGVGFRYTARAIAQRFAVRGFVRNLPDGRVELLAQGPPKELTAFLQEVREHFQTHIRDEKQDKQPARSGEFSGFEIRH
jgi:acylphosphatase